MNIIKFLEVLDDIKFSRVTDKNFNDKLEVSRTLDEMIVFFETLQKNEKEINKSNATAQDLRLKGYMDADFVAVIVNSYINNTIDICNAFWTKKMMEKGDTR